MITQLLRWLREVWQKMIGTTDIKRAFNVDLEMSGAMMTALEQWSRMYSNQAPWLSRYVTSLNLPAAIAGEIARAVTIEMEMEISGSSRASFLQQQMLKLVPKLRSQLEYGCAKGGLMFKPYLMGESLGVDFVQADQFYPVSFDANGNITTCIFSDQRKIGDSYFTRLEYHAMAKAASADGKEKPAYFVKNVAFKSATKDSLGTQVSLDTVDVWAQLAPEATIANVERPLFAYFRFPLANNIDPSSPLGVSCYARAIDLIEQSDRQWSDFLHEFKVSKAAIYVDELAFAKDKEGKSVLPDVQLYRAIKTAGNIGDAKKLFEGWSPTIREMNFLNGLDAMLKRIEFNCGLAYGTLSDPNEVDKTATEILSSKQRSAATVVDTQKALEDALTQLLYAMNVWADLGNLAPRGSYQVVYKFDDSLVTDRDAQFSQDQSVVGMRAMSRVEFRMRNYGETEAVAKQKIQMVDDELTPDPFAEGA